MAFQPLTPEQVKLIRTLFEEGPAPDANNGPATPPEQALATSMQQAQTPVQPVDPRLAQADQLERQASQPAPRPQGWQQQVQSGLSAGLTGFDQGLHGHSYNDAVALQQEQQRQAQQDLLARAKQVRDQFRLDEEAKRQAALFPGQLTEQQNTIAAQQRVANAPVVSEIPSGGKQVARYPDGRVVITENGKERVFEPLEVTLKDGSHRAVGYEKATNRYVDSDLNDISAQVQSKYEKNAGGDDMEKYLEAIGAKTPQDRAAGIEKYKTMGPNATANIKQSQIDRVPALQGVAPELVGHASEDYNKASDKWLEAKQRADDLGSFIDAARKGNKVAGAYAPVEQVMFTNASQGIKRVNETELGSIRGAGDAKDRVQSFFDKYTTGQPIPEGILNDMDTIRQAIMRNADTGFTRKANFIKQGTGAKYETDPYKAHGETPGGSAAGTVQPGSGGWSAKVVK